MFFLEAYNHTTEARDEIALVPCDQSWDGGGAIRHCCDPGAADCCSNSAWINIPVGTIIRNPSPVSTTPSSFGIASSNAATTSASQSPTQSASSTALADSKSLRIGLGVGLGIGLPMALALISLLAFLVWVIRKKNQAEAVADRVKMREGMQVPSKPELHSDSCRLQELHSDSRRLELSTSV